MRRYRNSEGRHWTFCDVNVMSYHTFCILIGCGQCFVDVTAKVILSLVKYEKVISSMEKYFTLDDKKTIPLKTDGYFMLS